MGSKAYIGYSLYFVGNITKEDKKSILIWEARDSSLVSIKELKDNEEVILKGSTEKDEYYNWLDFIGGGQ